jgi:hypothetical protein
MLHAPHPHSTGVLSNVSYQQRSSKSHPAVRGSTRAPHQWGSSPHHYPSSLLVELHLLPPGDTPARWYKHRSKTTQSCSQIHVKASRLPPTSRTPRNVAVIVLNSTASACQEIQVLSAQHAAAPHVAALSCSATACRYAIGTAQLHSMACKLLQQPAWTPRNFHLLVRIVITMSSICTQLINCNCTAYRSHHANATRLLILAAAYKLLQAQQSASPRIAAKHTAGPSQSTWPASAALYSGGKSSVC